MAEELERIGQAPPANEYETLFASLFLRARDIPEIKGREARGQCCSWCFKWGAKNTCGRCKLPAYCSAVCQTADFKEGGHKKECSLSQKPENQELIADLRRDLDLFDFAKGFGDPRLDKIHPGYNDGLWSIIGNAGNPFLQVLLAKAVFKFESDVEYSMTQTGWTLLHACGYDCYPLLAAFLLKRGAEIDRVTNMGSSGQCTMSTALHLACMSQAIPMIEFLVEKGADIEKRNKGGKTPVFAIIPPKLPHLKLMQRLGANMRAVAGPMVNGEPRKYFNLASFIIMTYLSAFFDPRMRPQDM